jgi:hypothetical protein
MTRVSAPGLGSLLDASELTEDLSCSAGRLSSKAERGRVEFGPRRSNALFGRRLSLSERMGRTVALSCGRGDVRLELEGCFECLICGILEVY